MNDTRELWAAVDVETTGLRWWSDALIGIGIYAGPGEDYFYTGTEILAAKAKLEELRGQGFKFSAHNSKFDYGFLLANGIDITFDFDTKTCIPLLKDKPGSNALEPAAVHYLKVYPWKDSVQRKALIHEDMEDVEEYCITDCKYTWELTYVLIDKLKEENQYEFFVRRLHILDGILCRASIFGFPISVTEINSQLDKYKKESEDAVNNIRTKYAKYIEPYETLLLFEKLSKYKTDKSRERVKQEPPRINLNSSKQLLTLLVRYAGIEMRDVSGKPSTSDDAMYLASKHEIIKDLIRYRELQKPMQFFTQWLELADHESRIHTTFNVDIARTGRLSSSSPNCLSLDTEILTDSGFKRYNEINSKDRVAAFSNGTISWEAIQAKYVSETKLHELVSIKNTHTDMLLTSNHRCILQNRKNETYLEDTAINVKEDYRHLHGGLCNDPGSLTLSDNMIKLMVAIQADGELSSTNTLRFGFTKQRKVTRLLNILGTLPYTYTHTVKNNRHNIIVHNASELHQYKTFSYDLLKLSPHQRHIFLEELPYWDGLYTRKESTITYGSSDKHNVDVVQALSSLHEYRAHIHTHLSTSGTLHHRLYITRQNYSLTTNIRKEVFEHRCQVWCIKVPSGAFIARRGNDTFVTGNCQQLPVRKDPKIRNCFVARPGRVLVIRDLSQVEPRFIAHYSQDPKLLNVYKNNISLYGQVAYELGLWEGDPNELKAQDKTIYNVAKTLVLAILYNLGSRKMAFELEKVGGVSYSAKQCRSFIDQFFSSFAGVAQLRDTVTEVAGDRGYLKNFFGRHVFVPKEKAYRVAMNSLIQSSASDFMCMLQIYQRDRVAKLGANLLLLVHDEEIYEVDEDKAKELDKLLEDTAIEFGERMNLRVPIVTEGGIYKCWGGEPWEGA